MNGELPDVQAGFWRGRRTRDQIANIPWIMEKAREFQQNIYFFFIVQKTLTMCITTNWKILRDWIPDHLTCLLRNLYVGQEAIVRTRHGKTDWFKIGKEVQQGCILSLRLFNSMQSTSAFLTSMLGWRKLKLKSRLQGEIPTISNMQMILL